MVFRRKLIGNRQGTTKAVGKMYRWLAQLEKAFENELFRWKIVKRSQSALLDLKMRQKASANEDKKHTFCALRPKIHSKMRTCDFFRNVLQNWSGYVWDLTVIFHLNSSFSKPFSSWASCRYIFLTSLVHPCRSPLSLRQNTSGIWSEYSSEYFFRSNVVFSSYFFAI